jgi:hypothetical protein
MQNSVWTVKAIMQFFGFPRMQAFKRLKWHTVARKYHPNRNNSSFAEDMIKKINASFEVLYDKELS